MKIARGRELLTTEQRQAPMQIPEDVGARNLHHLERANFSILILRNWPFFIESTT
jgi:hypothetical protein